MSWVLNKPYFNPGVSAHRPINNVACNYEVTWIGIIYMYLNNANVVKAGVFIALLFNTNI